MNNISHYSLDKHAVLLLVALALSTAAANAHGTPGTLLWEDRFDQAQHFDGATAVATQGDIAVVTGSTTDANFITNLLVRAYDNRNGSVLWQAMIEAPGGYGQSRAVAIGGNIAVVSGYIVSTRGDGDWVVAAYDLRTGQFLWRDIQDYDGKYDEATQLLIKGDRVFAAGAGACPADTLAPCDMITRAYDLKTGALLWQDRFDHDGGDDYAYGLAASGDRLFVTGEAGQTEQSDGGFLVRTLDARTGTVLWQDMVVDPGFYNVGIKIAAQGERVFAVGFRKDDWLVRGYDGRNGQLLWEQTYRLEPNSVPGTYDGAWQVATDDKHVVVAGYGSHTGRNFVSRDWVVNSYDVKTGTLLWSDRYDTGGPDEAVGGLAIDHGQVFALGLASPNFEQMFLRAYDLNTGRILWDDALAAPSLNSFPWGVGTIGLAEDHGRVTICGLGAIGSHNSNYDWFVRTYDAGF